MRISVRIKPRSSVAKDTKVKEGEFIVAVRQAPVEGEANKALIRALADYFDLAPSRIVIVKGSQSRTKIVEIMV